MNRKKSPNFALYSKYDQMVLLHRRDDNTSLSPNKWDFFGGEIKRAESVKDAAVRELYEELGVSISISELNQLEKGVYYILFPKYKTRDLRLDEGAGFSWYTFEEALKLGNLAEGVKEKLEKLKKKVAKRKAG